MPGKNGFGLLVGVTRGEGLRDRRARLFRGTHWRSATAVMALMAAGIPSRAAGQEAEEPPQEFWSQLHLKVALFGQVALSADDYGEYRDDGVLGGGAGLVATIWHREQPRIALRFEADAIEYDYEGGTLTSAGIGPQLHFRDGPIRPYAFATLGGTEARTKAWPEDERYDRNGDDPSRGGREWASDKGKGKDDDKGKDDHDKGDRDREGEWNYHEPRYESDGGAYVGVGFGIELRMYTGEMPVSLDLSVSHMSRSRSSVVPLARPRDDYRGDDRRREEKDWPEDYGKPWIVPDREMADLVKVRFGVSVAVF